MKSVLLLLSVVSIDAATECKASTDCAKGETCCSWKNEKGEAMPTGTCGLEKKEVFNYLTVPCSGCSHPCTGSFTPPKEPVTPPKDGVDSGVASTTALGAFALLLIH